MAYVGGNQHKSAQMNAEISQNGILCLFTSWEANKLPVLVAYVIRGYIRFGQNRAHPPKIGSDKNGPIGHNRDVASQGIKRGPFDTPWWKLRGGVESG
jgi:hypothetical protein